jgi:hypothetical protein
MVDRRVPGRPPVLLTSRVRDEVQALPADLKGQLLANLDLLRDTGSLPQGEARILGGQTVRGARIADGLYIFYRELSSEELERQGKNDAVRGVVILAVLRSGEPAAWSLARNRL